MNLFSYERASSVSAALELAGSFPASKYLGGGTNLVDLMRETVERPEMLVDVSGLDDGIKHLENGGLLIAGAAKNTALAADRRVRADYPVLARAILSGASAQIRNMATVAGNIMQRTRCRYFYDSASHCNKRQANAGCDAIGGFNRYHAVLGASQACIATHPSDMCVALAALDAIIHLQGPDGARTVAMTDFHRLPGDHPEIETDLQPGELITAIEIPPLPFARRSAYRKVRDRASYAFALVSVAAALDIDGSGTVQDVRIALGGVAHKPWRAFKAEALLKGMPASGEAFRTAAEAELSDAAGQRHNQFKIELAKRTIAAVLADLKEQGA